MDSLLREENIKWWENIGCIMYIVKVVFEIASAVLKFILNLFKASQRHCKLLRVLWACLVHPVKNKLVQRSNKYQLVKDFHIYQHAKHQLHNSILF